MPVKLSQYVLAADHTPIPEPDLLRWAEWFEDIRNRRVAETEIPGYTISTVFLGIDHQYNSNWPPLLFETMIFADHPDDMKHQMCWRTATWDDAELMHRMAVWYCDPPECET